MVVTVRNAFFQNTILSELFLSLSVELFRTGKLVWIRIKIYSNVNSLCKKKIKNDFIEICGCSLFKNVDWFKNNHGFKCYWGPRQAYAYAGG